MITVPTETYRILKNKKKLEKELNVKLKFKGKKATIDGAELQEFITGRVIEALNLGFQLQSALALKDEDFIFEKINIKNLTKRHDLARVRARLIGQNGRTKKTLQELSGCAVCIKDNKVGIIGHFDCIRAATNAVTNLIHGSKQSSVYAFLEKERAKLREEDLGLKE